MAKGEILFQLTQVFSSDVSACQSRLMVLSQLKWISTKRTSSLV